MVCVCVCVMLIWLDWVLVAACGFFSCSMQTVNCIICRLVSWPGFQCRSSAESQPLEGQGSSCNNILEEVPEMTTRWQKAKLFGKMLNSRESKFWMTLMWASQPPSTRFHQKAWSFMVCSSPDMNPCAYGGTSISVLLKFLLTTSHHLGVCQLPQGLCKGECL